MIDQEIVPGVLVRGDETYCYACVQELPCDDFEAVMIHWLVAHSDLAREVNWKETRELWGSDELEIHQDG